MNDAITFSQVGVPLPAVWRDTNNVEVPVTGIVFLAEIARAISDQTQLAYAESWILKKRIDDAKNPEELDVIG